MKIVIGGDARKFAVGDTTAVTKAEVALENFLIGEVVQKAQELTPVFLNRLGKRLQMVASDEAARIFDVVIDIIDQPVRGGRTISYNDLVRGINMDPTIGSKAGGAIKWPSLTKHYEDQKDRKRSRNKGRFFRYNDAMRNLQFRARGRSIVNSKLGGIVIDVDRNDVKGSSGRYLARTSPAWDKQILASEVKGELLGRVTVNIFPRLSPSLAAGLGTRRWADAGDGKMEKFIFGSDTKTSAKLTARGYKRPLVAPIVQFFILARIPSAIKKATNNLLTRTGLKE